MTQAQKVLALLQSAGRLGVNSYDITYKHRIKQGPTRIFELKKLGYQITTRSCRNGSTDYILIPGHTPEKNAPQPNAEAPRMRWEFDKSGTARQVPVAIKPQQEAIW